MGGPRLGHQEYAIALASDRAADEFLGMAVAVYFRSVDDRHAKRNAGAQRFFLGGWWTPSFAEMPGALTQRWDSGAISEPDGSRWAF
jgi:hypothetical protein